MSEQVTRRTGFSVRALASLSLFCAGAWLVPSGIALHAASHEGFAKWSHLFMSMHNTASLVFVAAAVIHLTLNWKVMMRHVRTRTGVYAQFRRELVIAVVGVSGFVLLVASHALRAP